MLIINKESVQALKRRLDNLENIGQCREELKKMIEIKEASLWRAEEGQCCCCAIGDLLSYLTWEIELLENALKAVDGGNIAEASAILDRYAGQWDKVF